MTETLTITRPDDWHVHLRQGEMLNRVAGFTAAQFGRAMVMPNLVPPVVTAELALTYERQIREATADYPDFTPLLSLYLTDNTPPEEVVAVAASPQLVGFKLYPAGATTNSDSGVTRMDRVMPVLEKMAELGVVLQIHGEVTDAHVDVFDREAVFIEQILEPLVRELPELKIVFEHITTAQGVNFVRDAGDNVAATITVHHLLHSRNEMFRGGLRPHAYCLPVLKRESHRLALLEAATSGDSSFFLGTDSAPHARSAKESACGCAGVFSAPVAMPLYATVFEGMEALHRLEPFASHHGADFYGLDRNPGTLVLRKADQSIPATMPGPDEEPLVPLAAEGVTTWSVEP